MSNADASTSSQPKSYTVRKGDTRNLRFHIAKMNVPHFSMNACAPPIRLYRGHPQMPPVAPRDKAASDEEDAEQDAQVDRDARAERRKEIAKEIAPYGGAQKNKTKAFKKKTTFYQNASSETTGDNLKKIRALRKQESLPWIFEDGDGEFNLVGKLQGEQGANYAVLVFENNEFTMVPVTHWYRFQPRITYRTLTTDEAEERLASKNVNLDRWMMHRLKPQTESITQDANLSEIGRQFTATSGNQHNQQKLAADELLYDEEFQDDEEVDQEEEDAMSEDDETALKKKTQLRGDDEDMNEEDQEMQKSRLLNTGKETKKLLKKMNQDFLFGETLSGLDSDEDPYASSNDEMDEEEEREGAPRLSRAEREEATKQSMSLSNVIPKVAPWLQQQVKQKASVVEEKTSHSSRSSSPALSMTQDDTKKAQKRKKRQSNQQASLGRSSPSMSTGERTPATGSPSAAFKTLDGPSAKKLKVNEPSATAPLVTQKNVIEKELVNAFKAKGKFANAELLALVNERRWDPKVFLEVLKTIARKTGEDTLTLRKGKK